MGTQWVLRKGAAVLGCFWHTQLGIHGEIGGPRGTRIYLRPHNEAVAEPALELKISFPARGSAPLLVASWQYSARKAETLRGGERGASGSGAPFSRCCALGWAASGALRVCAAPDPSPPSLRFVRPSPGARRRGRVEHRAAIAARGGRLRRGPHPLQAHAQRQLHQGHGRRGQR